MEAANFAPRAKNNERIICAVEGCGSTPGTHLDLKFHQFPKAGARFVYVKNSSNQLEKLDQREAWLRAMDVTDVSSSAKLCSLHFTEEDYLPTGTSDGSSQNKRLKGIAVPSNNLHNCHGEESKSNFEFVNIKMEEMDYTGEDNEETNEMKDSEQTIVNHMDCNNTASNNFGSDDCDVKPDLQSIKIERRSIERDSKAVNNRVSVKDAEAQVDTADVLTCFSNMNKNSDLNVLTGIKTFVLLNEIVDKIDTAYDNKYEMPGRQFKTSDRLLLTYAKLKHDLPHDFLSILFQCSTEDCERIFLETKEMLKNLNLLPKRIKKST